MSVTSNASQVGTYQQLVYRALLVMNLTIMLFPPIYMAMANGNMASALVYFFGAPIVLIVSMFILNAIAKNHARETHT